MKKFIGSKNYIVSDGLQDAVNLAIILEKPLLIKGEPGTGKTALANAIADGLEMDLIIWSIKSTTKAEDGLYKYDTVRRLYDSQFSEGDVKNIKQYIELGKLGEAFTSEKRCVLLIDEIDKADIEFPNDLLWELDRMEFYIPETKETITAKKRPIVIITSNAEKELPDAFLRRCIFHFIEFPDMEKMSEIVKVHFPDVEEKLLQEALGKFYEIRETRGIQKYPATSEFLDWLKALSFSGISEKKLKTSLPFLGALLKKDSDYEIIK